MNNAEKFKQIFGLHATELWSMPESDFLEWLNRDVETTQIDHTADIGKKAEGDCISRKTALDALAKQMPRSYTPDGSHPADEEIYKIQEIYVDCIESIEILPAAQPEIIHCKDCKHHFVHRCMDSIPTEICDLNQTFYDAEVDFCSLAERRTE